MVSPEAEVVEHVDDVAGVVLVISPEAEVVEHVDDVAGVVLVLLPEMLQYSDLLLGLSVEPLLISNLERNKLK